MGEEIMNKLPEGWTIDKEDNSKLPPGWKIEKESSRPKEVRDVVGEELADQGIEDENEFERAAELGTAEATRGFISGGTFGVTENIPGLKTGDNAAATTGKVLGSFIPLSKMISLLEPQAMKLASKSPIFQRQIGNLLTMFGVGAADTAITSVAKGEMPSGDEVLEHGLMWAALDLALQGAGATGRFVKGLLSKSKATGIGRKELVNQIGRELEESGIDMTNVESVSQKALEILERPVTEAEQALGRQLQLSKPEPSPITPFATNNLFKQQLAAQEERGSLSLANKPITKEEKVAQELLKPDQVTPKDLKTRKINDEPVNRLTKESVVLSEPYQPESSNFTKEAETLEKNAIQDQIDSVGTRAATEEELGASIKEDIETQLEARKEEYRPLYEQAEQAAGELSHVPQKTAQEAGNRLRRISRLATRPEGYNAVLRNLETVLEDAGFVIQRNEQGAIEQIISESEVPVENTIELARRLNEIVDYEAVEPTVKDALRGVARAAKQDIRTGLASNPDALAAFELAEQAHAQTAQRFNKESIRKVRGQQAGEKVSKMTESPSTLGDLREVLSPKQMLQIEREILEKLNNQSFEKAQKSLREMERHLSAENRKLARDIVEAKNPHNPSVRKKLSQDAILNDMSNAFTNGTRPTKTLDLWKTPKGQKLVKETFHNSPNWPQVKQYLEKQSFNDMVSSVLKDGKIDLKKLKSFMKDPATMNNIRSQGGEEAVTFFRDLDAQVKQLEENIKLLERFPKDSDISRGKELLRKTKEKNIKLSKEEKLGLDKLSRKQEKPVRGQELIRKTKEKAQLKPKETKAGEHALETQRARNKESKGERGSKILERMAQKDFPLQSKAKKWKEWFSETLGLTPRAAMSVFGLMKLGLPNTVVSLVGYRMFNKMLTNPRVRRAFSEAAKQQTNPLKFILAIENLGDVMDETN